MVTDRRWQSSDGHQRYIGKKQKPKHRPEKLEASKKKQQQKAIAGVKVTAPMSLFLQLLSRAQDEVKT